LNCLPLTSTTSPGDSSVPASREPTMTVSAPATRALAMSPEYCRPPSPISGTPAGPVALEASWMAVTWGTPTPATTRVVQIDQGLLTVLVDEVAANHLDVSEKGIVLDRADHLQGQAGVAVGGVDHQHIRAGLSQRAGALEGISEEADPGTDQQTPLAVLGGVGELLGLDEILDGDQPAQDAVVVDQRQALTLVLAQHGGRLLRGDVLGSGEQLGGHHVADAGAGPVRDGDETQVAVGADAQQAVLGVDHGQTGDPVL